MPTGTVKWFSDDKGYGSLRPMTARRTSSCTTAPSPARVSKTLAEGAKVNYESEDGPKGPAAASGSVTDGLVLTETRALGARHPPGVARSGAGGHMDGDA